MTVNYVLMYGTPYLKYREFETFEDMSKFIVNKRIVNYTIFEKMNDEKEVEMIYRDNDIHVLKKELENANKINQEHQKLNGELREENEKLKKIIEKYQPYFQGVDMLKIVDESIEENIK